MFAYMIQNEGLRLNFICILSWLKFQRHNKRKRRLRFLHQFFYRQKYGKKSIFEIFWFSWSNINNAVLTMQMKMEIFLGWALIYIQSFSALIQRFLRFQRCSELKQPTLILTSLVITDSVMNISEHLWFSAEHYWQAANRQRPWKKPKQVFFFNIDTEETRNRKFQNNF